MAGMALSRHALKKRLDAVLKAVEGEGYDDALARIHKEQRRFPRSVYFMALERQIEQLREFKNANEPAVMQRKDILDSLPVLAQRALEHPEASPETLRVDSATINPPTEHDAALKWLLTQYLQNAYAHLVREDYESALAEIQRMYILDSGNTQAHDLELRISKAREKTAG
jgi:hypothetical protein